jgi:multidrug efflux pump subunit AcrA (membrane-fusion protein)
MANEWENEERNLEATINELEVAESDMAAESEAAVFKLDAAERDAAVDEMEAAEREAAVNNLEAAEREAAVNNLEAAEREAAANKLEAAKREAAVNKLEEAEREVAVNKLEAAKREAAVNKLEAAECQREACHACCPVVECRRPALEEEGPHANYLVECCRLALRAASLGRVSAWLDPSMAQLLSTVGLCLGRRC